MSTNLDYSQVLQETFDETNEALKVNVVAGSMSGGGASQVDKSSFTEGSSSSNPIAGTYNDSLGSDPSEDSSVTIRSTVKRALHTNLRNTSGTEIATSSNPIRIDPTGTTTQPVSNTGLTAITSRLSGSFVPAAYDEVALTYVPSGNGTGQIQTATYKLSSVTVKTLTLSYDSNDRLSGVVAS